jgi:hypothetical protein
MSELIYIIDDGNIGEVELEQVAVLVWNTQDEKQASREIPF